MTSSSKNNLQNDPSVELFEKLQQLEITQSYQEDVIENLEKTVAQQHQDIQRLEHKLKLLSDYLRTLRQDVITNPDNEVPPPHY